MRECGWMVRAHLGACVRARARARARSAGRRRPSAGRERTEGRVAVGSSRTPPVVGRGASSSDESAIVCAHGGGKKVRSRQSARSRDPSAGFQTRWSAGTSSRWRCTRLPVARAAGRVRLCGCPRALQLWACSVRVCTLALVAEENRRRVLRRAICLCGAVVCCAFV